MALRRWESISRRREAETAPYTTGSRTASRRAVSRAYSKVMRPLMVRVLMAQPAGYIRFPGWCGSVWWEGTVNFIPQIPDVHIHHIGVVGEIIVPDVVCNL